MTPVRPDLEAGFWYFYYFLTERGRAGLIRQPARDRPSDLGTQFAGLAFR